MLIYKKPTRATDPIIKVALVIIEAYALKYWRFAGLRQVRARQSSELCLGIEVDVVYFTNHSKPR